MERKERRVGMYAFQTKTFCPRKTSAHTKLIIGLNQRYLEY